MSENGTGWSLPRSSVRSISGSSRSRSGSASDEESESIDVDAEVDDYGYGPARSGPYGGRFTRGYGGYTAYHRNGPKTWKREEEEFSIGFSVPEEDEYKDRGREVRKGEEKEWDGMEMEMDMD